MEVCSDHAALLLSSPPLLTCFFLACALLLLAVVLLSPSSDGEKGSRASGRKLLPPGSFGLPFGMGETLQFAFRNTCAIGTPPPFLSSRLQKYGTVFKTNILGCPTIVSMDPNLNKLLLSSEEKLVQVNFPSFMKKIVGPILTIHGERHLQLRELFLSILSPKAIQSIHLIQFQEHICLFLRPWLNMPIVDAQQEFKKIIFTYIVKILLNLAPEEQDTKLLMKDFLLIIIGCSSMPINLPGTTYNKVLKARRRIKIILTRLIQARRNTTTIASKDFLDVLLNKRNECGNNLTECEIVELIFFLTFGGFETTSVLLTNVVKFLSENDHIVDELRKEHTSIKRNKKANIWLSWDDFKEMKFTKLVIKEALRLASIVHFVTREALQDIIFKDMLIPKGWKIMINSSMVHLNPSYYENPLKFDPWRWKDTQVDARPFFIPFSGGLRGCPGSFLVEFEVSIFIHYLVTSYKWKRIKHANGQVDVVSGLTLPTMKKGLPIVVSPL